MGIDVVPSAVAEARAADTEGATYVVADATSLAASDLGTFDFFLDVAASQGFGAEQRRAQGESISALANPGATLLMLCFGRTRLRSLIGGVSHDDVQTAFSGWETIAAEPADTTGLGWPMNNTAPQWYRLRRRSDG